jgi:flagella basal body P-ring formation protein FlgA
MFHLPLLLLTLAADVPVVHTPDSDAVMRAMKKALAERPDYAAMNIEIVDLSHFPVPEGEMDFEWKGLTPPATGQTTARWRGVVRHDVDHTYSIWAVVRLTVPCKRIIATETIRPDVPIEHSEVQEESYDGFPSGACNSSANAVVGKVVTRTVSVNTPILPVMLALPASVLKGEQAVAEYRDGGVSLSLPVIVERNGRIGEIIAVHNPATHKVMLAQVIGEGKVLIEGASRTASISNGDKQ